MRFYQLTKSTLSHRRDKSAICLKCKQIIKIGETVAVSANRVLRHKKCYEDSLIEA